MGMSEAEGFDPKTHEQLSKLENAQREVELKPAVLLEWVGLKPEDLVVDLGAGAGFYAIPAAQRGAHVIAIDPDRSLLYALELRARRLGLNIKTIVNTAEDWLDHAPAGQVDLAVLSFVIHEKPLREHATRLRLLRGINHILQSQGKLLVVEFRRSAELTMHGMPEPSGWVPGPEDERRVGPVELAKLGSTANLAIRKVYDLPPICYAALLTKEPAG